MTKFTPTPRPSVIKVELHVQQLATDDEEDDHNAAPLHLLAVRHKKDTPLRTASGKATPYIRRSNTRGSSRSTSRSRSTSPAHTTSSGSDNESDGGGSTSTSSMSDILTDRMGLEEMEPYNVHVSDYLHNSLQSNLPSVNERMSEETLDDCHAFSDVLVGSTVGRRLSGDSLTSLLPPVNERASQKILEDLHAFSDVQVGSNSGRRHNSEPLSKSLPPVNEHVSQETLEDRHAFSSTLGRRLGAETPSNCLPPVNERMSQETLNDHHAFKDVTLSERSSFVREANDIETALETLAEDEEEEDDDFDIQNDEQTKKQQSEEEKVKSEIDSKSSLNDMEKLSFQPR